MRILILNWRDIKNPASGGAEIVTHEYAQAWVRAGHKVTLFTSSYPGAKTEEIIDGVKIIRKGSPAIRKFFNSVHFQAFWCYVTKGRGNYDMVIDEVHGIPFFTPFYAWGVKRFTLVCEVAGEVWDAMWPWPYNILGKAAERFYLFLYSREKFLTISQSTEDDLIKAGIPQKNIMILPMGVNIYPLNPLPPKEKTLTLIFVGRITRTKGLDQAVRAMALIKKEIPEIKLWVVGSGDGKYADEVKKLIKELNLEKSVIFHGFVSEKEKFTLMAKAHFIVVPSIKEGFGLIVPEAGSVGTPAIGYNVQGLRDVIKNGYNGFLIPYGDFKKMADIIIIIEFYKDNKTYKALSKNSLMESTKYNFTNVTNVMNSVIENIY